MLNLYASDFEYDLDTVENVSLENRGAGKFYIIFIGLLNIKLVSSQSGLHNEVGLSTLAISLPYKGLFEIKFESCLKKLVD